MRAPAVAPGCIRRIPQADGYADMPGIRLWRRGQGGVPSKRATKPFDVHASAKPPLTASGARVDRAPHQVEGDMRSLPLKQRLRVRNERTAPSMAALSYWQKAGAAMPPVEPGQVVWGS